MSDVYYKVHYAGVDYFTETDPELVAHLLNEAPALMFTDTSGIELTFSITPGVPIVVSEHRVKDTGPRSANIMM